MPDPFVIVGAGLAGAKAAETLRGEGSDDPVVLVGEEPEQPYERPPLSKGYLLGKAERDSARVHASDWYADNDVDLVALGGFGGFGVSNPAYNRRIDAQIRFSF